MTRTYLDYNASAPLKPEAREAVVAALDHAGNPSSVHWAGRAARKIVEDARASVAAYVGASADAIVFTSGATEANNLALTGVGGPDQPVRRIVGATEHESVLDVDPDAEILPVRPDGAVDIARLQRMLTDRDWRPCLVSVMAVNNETGVVQPIDEVVQTAHAAGAKVHCDAVQASGLAGGLRMRERGIDIVTLSAHKLGGPRGAGAIAVSSQVELRPMILGGGQERRMRSGTENVAGIAGFGAVCRDAENYLPNIARARELRDRVERGLADLPNPPLVIAANGNRAGHVTNIALVGVPAETQVMALDIDGIAVSAGAACSSGKVKTSHVLSAMGFEDKIAGCAIRVSFGWASSEEDADRFLEAYSRMSGRLAGR